MPQRPPPPVITGLGAVAPIGVGVPAFTKALRAGRSGTRRLDLPGDLCASSVAAVCPDFDPRDVLNDADLRRLPRLVPMALAAAHEAASSAGLAPDRLQAADTLGPGHARVGLVLGTGAGGIDFTLDQARIAHGPAAGRGLSLWTITNATHGNLAGELSIRLGLHGPSLCVSTGCASASDAVGLAMDLLRSDRPGAPNAMIVVGADAHVRWETLRGMELLKVISTRDFRGPDAAPSTASRPFDATRDGFVLGEGAWAVVLERAAHAEHRGAAPIAAALGYAATCDAYHRVRPAPDPADAVRAIHDALDDAAIRPDAVELIHYHGTATPLNDLTETRVVREAFGPHADRLRGTSVKSMIGHPQGASGLAALVASLGALADPAGPFVPPTINLHEPDPACDLDYTPNAAAPTNARTLLVNCSAFGAKNSVLVVQAAAG